MEEMQVTQTPEDTKEIEKVLLRAQKKVNATQLKDICHYLPVPSGGYMHHFTLKKMKSEQPKVLKDYLTRYILEVKNPKKVPPKKRAPRGSRNAGNVIAFTQEDLTRVMELARQAGDQEMLAKLQPQRSLATLKKELISSIRQEKIREDLWEQYIKECQSLDVTSQQEAIQTVLVEP